MKRKYFFTYLTIFFSGLNATLLFLKGEWSGGFGWTTVVLYCIIILIQEKLYKRQRILLEDTMDLVRKQNELLEKIYGAAGHHN